MERNACWSVSALSWDMKLLFKPYLHIKIASDLRKVLSFWGINLHSLQERDQDFVFYHVVNDKGSIRRKITFESLNNKKYNFQVVARWCLLNAKGKCKF